MISLLKKWIGMSPQVDIASLLAEGAMIVDVRSKHEYLAGHVIGSVNIPLEKIPQQLHHFNSKEQTIVTCCVSGRRSGIARDILKGAGYTNAHNGGPWQKVRQMTNK